jgi:hypothetical protein
MKRAFILVLVSLLLPLALSEPASAVGYITVHNATSYSVKVDIVYKTHLCRDDHPTIAPGGAFGTKIGACWIDHMTVTGRDGKCGPGVSSLGSDRFYIIEKKYPPHCEVHTSP